MFQGPKEWRSATGRTRLCRRRNRCGGAHPRSPRPLRMDSASGEGRLSRADLCHATDHRSVRHHPARLRPPAGRRRGFLQQAQEIQTRSGLPLYTLAEAQAALQYFRPVQFDETQQLCPQMSFRFVRAAHILGSSMVEVTLQTNGQSRRLLFTGDIGRVREQQLTPRKGRAFRADGG